MRNFWITLGFPCGFTVSVESPVYFGRKWRLGVGPGTDPICHYSGCRPPPPRNTAPPCGPDDARRCWSRYWPLTFQTLSFQMTVSICLILSFWLFSFRLFCAASIFCSMHALPFYIPHARTRARARARTHTHSGFRIFELFYSPQCCTFVLLNKTFSLLYTQLYGTFFIMLFFSSTYAKNIYAVLVWWRSVVLCVQPKVSRRAEPGGGNLQVLPVQCLKIAIRREISLVAHQRTVNSISLYMYSAPSTGRLSTLGHPGLFFFSSLGPNWWFSQKIMECNQE